MSGFMAWHLSKQVKRFWQKLALFWQIFLITWLVNLIGMLLVAMLITKMQAQRHNQEIFLAHARGQAQAWIEAYEAGEHTKNDHQRHHMAIWITRTDTGEALVQRRYPPPVQALAFTYTSEQGVPYQIWVRPPRPPKLMNDWLEHWMSLQLVWLGLLAALSSLVLSGLIIRPLRALQAYVQAYYQEQDLSLRVAPELSARHDELGALAREFNTMAEYVQTQALQQQELLRDVSHELRAPLTRLQVAVGLVERQLGAEASLSQRLHKECQRLDTLISELLTFNRVQQQRLQGQNYQLNTLVEEVLAEIQIEQKPRPWQWQALSTSSQGYTDTHLLKRALANVLSNALKYTPETALIRVCASVHAGYFQLDIEDAGAGVAAEHLADLFTPFVRLYPQQASGQGLGLSITRKAMQRLGGDAQAYTSELGGLGIRLRWPQQLPQAVLAS
ncbi:Signal transduction histidine kinase [Allopseudospirillum japonicum]|uniref:histidine kinase n=1 Tax=Allopseudospirillum japonicum TaxID=64971 RepID=A0A1H6RBE6_9GAMM|nr:ATP-binding protein [Allopseudospirillum japonicum]SEI48512.1 Signal transduction histidine kinase [Allopseudospirillum japonicum]